MEGIQNTLTGISIRIIEYRNEIQDLIDKSSFPFVVLVNVLLLSIKISKSQSIENHNHTIYQVVLEDENLGIFTRLNHFELILLALSVLNAGLLFFTQYKSYPLFKHPTETAFPSMNVDGDVPPNWDLERKSRNCTLEIIKLDDQSQKLIWVLHMWSPRKGSLRLFTWFSPAQTLMIYLSNSSNQLLLIPIAYLTAILLYFLVDHYEQSIIDQRIFAGQLLKESSSTQKITFSKILK